MAGLKVIVSSWISIRCGQAGEADTVLGRSDPTLSERL